MINEKELWCLKESIQTEVSAAEEEGYVFLDVGNELKHADEFLRRYRATRGWEGGYGGRTQNYELSFDLDREVLLLRAREALLRAKGALIGLKFPTWGKEHRYFYTELTGAEGLEGFDPRRGVVFMAPQDWELKGFPETQDGLWYRCSCRPTLNGVNMVDRFHSEGKRVGTYLSGGMMAITYALLPDSEEDWADEFMIQYAGYYWHGKRERFWGARGSSAEWNDGLVPDMDFSRWMMAQLEFASRIGFDFVHLDEAFGRYQDARELSERNPSFVVCRNNLARVYVDESWSFGWTAMGESLGDPSRWDVFHKNMRQRSERAHNIPWWGFHSLDPFEKRYQNLSYATTLANRGTNVRGNNPSNDYVEFSRRFSDYIYGSYVDVYVPQEIVRTDSPGESLRIIINRQVLNRGAEELILHLLNIDPNISSLKRIKLEVNASDFNLKWPPTITFATPESQVQELKGEIEGRRVRFEAPEIRTWGLVVMGNTLFPRVELRVKSRAGTPMTNPLDNGFVAGEDIELEARIHQIFPTDYDLELRQPEGWKCIETERDKTSDGSDIYTFRVSPVFARKGRGYAITPIITRSQEAMPSWPLLLQAMDKVRFRLIPPMAESPHTESHYELEVSNYSKPGLLTFSILLPDGWTADRTSFKLELGVGEAKRVPLTMTTPDYHIRFWDWSDVQIPIEWEFHGLRGLEMIKVRVFPTRFYIYADGVEKNIMHSYPNLYFIDDLEEARSALKRGEHVALWFVNRSPDEFAKTIDEFVALGAGVFWMGEAFPGENCPAIPEAKGLESKNIKYLTLLGEPEGLLLAPALRKRAVYNSDTGFKVFRIRAKNWGKVCAVWGPSSGGSQDNIQGTPALVISTDPKRRTIYIGSDLEATSEEHYGFEDRRHLQSYWYQTYIFYNLLVWASGAYEP